ncbi:MAG: hypothetical protein KF817_01920 [Phycisphaeraceae bacterium]|nr:hypothetical protein [Phycisphaeraceae bacterium]
MSPLMEATSARGAPPEVLRIGAVSFLNTVPLIDGVESLPGVHVERMVPSQLIDRLLAGALDVALASSVDYFLAPVPCPILPVGQLGCDGPTLTVRVYATRPIPQVTEVHADTDSHTSIALLRVLFRARFGRAPAIVPFDARERMAGGHPAEWPPAMLLIGDKVVTDSPPAVRYPFQLDLGDAWRETFSLPFVFAVWLTRPGLPAAPVRRLALVLDRERRRNAALTAPLIAEHGVPRGWPADLASVYLTKHIRYVFDHRSIEALACFGRQLVEAGVVADARPLEFALPPADRSV